PAKEFGRAGLQIDDSSDLFKSVGGSINCWMSHGDAAEQVPEGFKVLAHTDNSFSAAIGNPQKKFYGIQFHPEVVHTERGTQILKNFAQEISGAKAEWDMKSFIETTVKDIRQQ